MRAAAARSGMAPSAPYAHYRDREQLLQARWREPARDAAREIASVAEATADPVERIRLMLEVFLRLAENHPEVYRGAFMYVRPGSRPKPEARPLSEIELHRRLAAAIADGRKLGLFAPVAAAFAAHSPDRQPA